MEIIFESPEPRKFQIWRYHVSMSRLLIRSNKEQNAQKTRISLYFQSTGDILLSCFFEADTLIKTKLVDLGRRYDTSRYPVKQDHYKDYFVFSIQGEISGIISSSTYTVLEDNRSFHEKTDDMNMDFLLDFVSSSEFFG